mmetsp:Transcript_15065/g.28643  ORF Transcript_15065/g.28643 Transcript_15065/m.28643 type:complete len:526 (-) Transcript_15065:330-1907(-)
MAHQNWLRGSRVLRRIMSASSSSRSRLPATSIITSISSDALVATSSTKPASTLSQQHHRALPLLSSAPLSRHDLRFCRMVSSSSSNSNNNCDPVLEFNAMMLNKKIHTNHPNTHSQRQKRWASSSSSASNGERDLYTSEQRKQDHNHCVEMVKNRDMEGYLCGLLMPSSARESYFALRAFNVEIASIKDSSHLIGGRSRGGALSSSRSSSSSTPSRFDNNNTFGGVEEDESMGDSSLASRLRMQWWRDSIAEIYDHADDNNNDNNADDDYNDNKQPQQRDSVLHSLTSSREHNPTLRSLNYAIHRHQLTHRFLRRIIEAREGDLDVMQYDSMRDVAQYGEDTVSSLLYLNLECVGVRDEASDMVASDIGVGLGILTALRSTGFRATQGECSIPSDLATKHSVLMDTLWSAWDASINDATTNESSSQDALQLRNATMEMAEIASFHLHRAREKQSVVPNVGRPCLLPAICGLRYLDSLREVDYDVLHPSLVGGGSSSSSEHGVGAERRRKLGLMFLLGRTWLTGTF